MKTRWSIGLCALWLAAVTACGPAQDASTTPTGPTTHAMAGHPDLAGRTVTVAVENDYVPFNGVRESTGESYGWDYDALAEICRRVNCVPEFRQAPWDGIFQAVAAGTYDLAANGISVTAERDQVVDFSAPYMTVGQVLVLPFGATVDDLAMFREDAENSVGTQSGTTNEATARENFPAERVQVYPDFDAATQALLDGGIDAVVADNVTALRIIAKTGGRLKLGPQITSDEPLAFAFPPGSPLLDAFNAAIASMKQDGTLQAINDRWFNP
ncbi:MAG: amino acid ABC transporter substrate-binding protein [Deltaproteobacteria bacterium]|nr:amino acid ABC transporter substrate-binding protein [Deltaproteobacteria bacterium]